MDFVANKLISCHARYIVADSITLMVTVWQLSILIGTASVSTGVLTGLLYAEASRRCDERRETFASKTRLLQKQRLRLVHELIERLPVLKVCATARDYLAPLINSGSSIASNARQAAVWAFFEAVSRAMVSESFLLVGLFAAIFAQDRGGSFDLETFLVAQVYVASLRSSINEIAQGFRYLKEVHVALQPIEAFLREQCREKCTHLSKESQDGIRQVKFELPMAMGNQIAWKTVLRLRSEYLSFQPCELVVVSGPVGSGKSALLLALLGEGRLPSTPCVPGPIAFQPQIPYLFDGTIRDNVLFGIREDHPAYDLEKLQASCLTL